MSPEQLNIKLSINKFILATFCLMTIITAIILTPKAKLIEKPRQSQKFNKKELTFQSIKEIKIIDITPRN